MKDMIMKHLNISLPSPLGKGQGIRLRLFSMTSVLLSAFVAILALTACGEDEKEIVPTLDAPVVTIGNVTSSTIQFTWTAVEGVRQYSYRVTNPNGKVVTAGVTQERSVTASKLQPVTTYTIEVIAYPTVIGSANNSETKTEASTVFYEIIEDFSTTYVSSLQANMASVTNRGTINEDRSGDDYEADWYGVFTISKFCGVNNYDMVFKVNRDNTITILNGEGYDEDGRAILKTGKSSSATLSFDKIFIDEHSAVFDGPKRQLTFSAKNNGTGNKLRESTTETITWAEQ